MPLSPAFIYNDSNALKIFRYDVNLMSTVGNNDNQQRVTEDVYYTYTTLVAFNNSLEKGGKEQIESLLIKMKIIFTQALVTIL